MVYAGQLKNINYLVSALILAVIIFNGAVSVHADDLSYEEFSKLIPPEKNLDAKWERSLFERGNPTVYTTGQLKYIGMPIGGICAGQLYLGGDGKLWLWDIFNHQHEGIVSGQCEFKGKTVRARDGMNYVNPPEQVSPLDQGFAIRVKTSDGNVARTLDKNGFNNISFTGQYPVGYVKYEDNKLGVEVLLKAFSPFIPLDARRSSLPVTIMSYTVKNKNSQPVEVELAGWMENAVCMYTGSNSEVARKNRVFQKDGFAVLECGAERAAAIKTKPERADIVFEDFEKAGYEGWKVTGTAFADVPLAKGDVPVYQNFGDIQGNRLVSSHNVRGGEDVGGGDAHKGTLTSSDFVIERKYITFLIGGGAHKDRTCVNLAVDGAIVRTSTGKNDNMLLPESWDVSELQGKTAQIQIVDNQAGAWGNISIDDIVFSDLARLPVNPEPVEQRFDFGTMALAVLGTNDVMGCVDFEGSELFGKLSGEVKSESSLKSFDQTLKGGVGKSISLEPNQEKTVVFMVSWFFPHLKMAGMKTTTERYYSSLFDSAVSVIEYAAENFESLSSQTDMWVKTWYDSTLPYWFLDRSFANTSILATSTVYRYADGRFYGWEGIGCCQGTCTHVWQYAQAVARIFPELERDLRERVDFGLFFNEQDGMIAYRGEFGPHPAYDGQAGTILRAYREHQMTEDYSFLKKYWPKIRKAIDYLIDKDGNGDGIIEGAQPNTLDAAWYGKISWISSMYLATLRAGQEMAIEIGDEDFALKTSEILMKGQKNILELYNGEYFIQIEDPDHMDAIGTGAGCHIDQVFGQSYAFQLGLGRLYSENHIKSALKSLWKYNFVTDVGPFKEVYKEGRPYAIAGDGGLIMCTWPKGGKRADWEKHWQYGYFNECMSGFEYQVASHMVWEGMVREGMAVTRVIHDRYDASLRNPYNEIECSDHYARAMASYGVYLAMCGYEYHGPKGSLAFSPRLSPEDFKGAFTTASGWGSFKQNKRDKKQVETIDVKWGAVKLKTLAFDLLSGVVGSDVKVAIDNREVSCGFEVAGNRVVIRFEGERVIKAGQLMIVEIH